MIFLHLLRIKRLFNILISFIKWNWKIIGNINTSMKMYYVHDFTWYNLYLIKTLPVQKNFKQEIRENNDLFFIKKNVHFTLYVQWKKKKMKKYKSQHFLKLFNVVLVYYNVDLLDIFHFSSNNHHVHRRVLCIVLLLCIYKTNEIGINMLLSK